MEKRGLTAKKIQYMKPDPTKRLEVPAGPPGGLYFVVHPSGKKVWALRYRFDGRTRKATLDHYPKLSLAQARVEAVKKLGELEQGIDPMADEPEATVAPNDVTAVAEEWIARYVKPNTRTWPEVERILKREVLPAWKGKVISEIGRPDVLRVLDALVDRGVPVLANRTLSILKRWFGWALERGYLDASPVAGLRPPTAEKSRDRVLKPEELAAIWTTAPELGYPFGPYFQFVILTAQRRSEAAGVRWSHIDMEKAVWTLPKEVTKPGRVHDVPLSSAALNLLRSVPRFADGDYVFTTRSGKRPISGYSKSKAELDAKILERRQKQGIKDEMKNWTVHDLRRTAATWMAEAGVPAPVLSAILNHSPGAVQGITAIYNRFKYTEERRQALEAWAEFLTSLEASREEKSA